MFSKKKLVTVLAVSLITINVFPPAALGAGEEAGLTEAAEVQAQVKTIQTKTLTLQECLDIGVEGNIPISLANLSVESAAVNVKEAQSAAKSMQKLVDNSSSLADTTTYQALYIYPAQAQTGYDLALSSRDYTINSVKYGIESAYYGLQKAEMALEISRLALERSQAQLNSVQLKEEQGQVPKIDVLSAESNYLVAQSNYAQARDTVTLARMSLNKLLDLDIETELVLQEKISFSEGEAIDVKQAIEKAKKTNITYLSAEANLKMAGMTKEYEQKYYFPNSYIYQKADINYQEVKNNLKTAEIDLEIAVRNAYNSLETSVSNHNSLTASTQLAKRALDLAQLRYQEGLGTIYDVQDADLSYQNAELGLLDAIHNHNLAKAAFEYEIY